MSDSNNIKRAFPLFLISFLTLYFEIILIRWIPGQIHVLGFFTNLVLIAFFLGLGIGCATYQRAGNHESQFLVRLLVLTLSCLIIGKYDLLRLSPNWGEFILGEDFPEHRELLSLILALVFFLLTAFTQIPLGRRLGAALAVFPPLTGYSLNLAGGLLGVAVPALFSRFSFAPLWWFALGLAVYAATLADPRRKQKILVFALCAPAILGGVLSAYDDEIWTPYHRITMRKFISQTLQEGLALRINDQFFQLAMDWTRPYFSLANLSRYEMDGFQGRFAVFYNFPYQLLHPASVLVLGAGTGNDVSMAVYHGVPRIVGVEIDPAIAAIGKRSHPLHPYQDPRVELVVDDARHYLKNSREKFDLLIYGLLDSHLLMSYVSIVRLESFVYTEEAFREAAARLNSGGVLALAHVLYPDAPQQLRLFQTVNKVFPGRTYVVYYPRYRMHILLAGPDSLAQTLKTLPDFYDVSNIFRSAPPVKTASDNWPFMYLSLNSFWKSDYLKALAALLLISLLMVVRTIPEVRRTFSLHFLFLGAGFMLLEAKSITELGLLFGSTWTVNSIAIGAFLTAGLLANYTVHFFKLQKTPLFYLLLLTSLAIGAFLPLSQLLSFNAGLRILGGGLLVALPVYFSGIIFALSFKNVASPPAALGVNILGAVLGGFGEYTSMFFGLRSLYFVAAALYILSAFFIVKERVKG